MHDHIVVNNLEWQCNAIAIYFLVFVFAHMFHIVVCVIAFTF